jgi:S1-C subfamily serine protease
VIGEWNDWFSWMDNSGSGVFNVYGQLLGLLYASQTKYNSRRLLTYVIPAHAIKDDFEEATDGKYTLRVKQ